MKEKLLKLVYTNLGVSSFSYSLLGSSLIVLFGSVGMVLHISIWKIVGMVSGIVSGRIQSKYSHSDINWLLNISVNLEILYSIFYIISNFMMWFNLGIAFICLVIAESINSITKAFNGIYRERLNAIIFEDAKDRSRFDGNLQTVHSVASAIGFSLNAVFIYIASNLYSIDSNLVLLMLTSIHGCIGIIDLVVTLLERRTVTEYFTVHIK